VEAVVETGLLMSFNATKLKSAIKRCVLLRGEIILYLCESLIASPFLFSYPLSRNDKEPVWYTSSFFSSAQRAEV
jgi:hypothetical protein